MYLQALEEVYSRVVKSSFSLPMPLAEFRQFLLNYSLYALSYKAYFAYMTWYILSNDIGKSKSEIVDVFNFTDIDISKSSE